MPGTDFAGGQLYLLRGPTRSYMTTQLIDPVSSTYLIAYSFPDADIIPDSNIVAPSRDLPTDTGPIGMYIDMVISGGRESQNRKQPNSDGALIERLVDRTIQTGNEDYIARATHLKNLMTSKSKDGFTEALLEAWVRVLRAETREIEFPELVEDALSSVYIPIEQSPPEGKSLYDIFQSFGTIVT